jgi:hypothetical protein
MSLKRLLTNPWLIRITLIISIASCGAALVLLTQIDNIVNSKLYQFGLQFSSAWADSYWMTLRLALGLLGLSIALILVTLAVGFSKNLNKGDNIQRKEKIGPLLPLKEASKGLLLEEPPVVEPSFTPTEERGGRKIQRQETAKLNERQENMGMKDNGSQGLACPNCQKISSRPLVMLDFAEGKTKLVNVCPYCNFTLGEVDNQEKTSDQVQVQSGEKVKQRT